MFFQSARSSILRILFCCLHSLISAQSLLLVVYSPDYKISSLGDLVSILEGHGPGWGHEPDWGDIKLSKKAGISVTRSSAWDGMSKES